MGNALSEAMPPKSKFSVDDIPDLTGKVAIITGGNTGIGKVTCKYLLSHNAKVYMASRSPEKAGTAIAELKEVTAKDTIYFLQCDLSDLPSLKQTVVEFSSKESSLHMLFNNAGVMTCPMDQLTKQGYDMQFGTNVIGHAYFTKLLLPTLLATAKASPEGKVRVINTASNGHLGASKIGIDYETLKDTPERKQRMGPWSLYFQSKWGNVVFAKELARRYGDQGIVSTALNPGGIRTDLQRHLKGMVARVIDLYLYDADPYGALTQLYAGTMPEGLDLNGKYLWPFARVAEARKDTDSPEAGKKLWEYIEEQTKDI